ncbi:DUF3541 domain-containing protein [Vibrio comitans]|uniref:DUF3541 domain-containing protein n=1 Tax=Vibrio comitans NBRC 102076 TaxID=1219078 RepID=A0A4Y3IQZ9_9VIBR|nr:DUF3541 domain-containing protein [Vibrio comitans]GEA61248.1 hypothetical protein VCO01S_24410 [Vibrio comitans NBRC 102076]
MTKKSLVYIGSTAIVLSGVTAYWFQNTTSPETYRNAAQTIKQTYEQQLFTLSSYKQGHFGLRMFRQTQDPKYLVVIQEDIGIMSIRLNQLSEDLSSKQTMQQYAEQRLTQYRHGKDERSKRRLAATEDKPEYFYLGLDLLRYMARVDDYGLRHRNDKAFRKHLKQYPFDELFTNKTMIKAWAAQLANQAYWLKQLDLGDHVQKFTQALRETYPDHEDYRLSLQQYENKLYGMTHIIIADSGYYQHQVNEADHAWIYDYFRQNIEDIITYTKQDIIAEVGISFLLAGLEDDPVVYKAREAIRNSIEESAGRIPSVSGNLDISYGEHRNVLAIMLLNWQSPNIGPNTTTTPSLFETLPFGLALKQ